MDATTEYVNGQIRAATARNLLQLGFTQSSMACVDALTDITTLYLKKVASWVQLCAEHAGHRKLLVSDVSTAFAMMKISEPELYEYMRQVRSVIEFETAPKFPVEIVKSSYPINIRLPIKELDSLKDESDLINDHSTSGLKPLPDFSEATAYSLGFVRPATSRSSTQLRINVKRTTPYSPPEIHTHSKVLKKRYHPCSIRKGKKICDAVVNPGPSTISHDPSEQPEPHTEELETQTVAVKQSRRRKQVTAKGRATRKAPSDHDSNKFSDETAKNICEESVIADSQVEPNSAEESRQGDAPTPCTTEKFDNRETETGQIQRKVPPIRIRFSANGPYIVKEPTPNTSRCKKAIPTFPFLASDLMRNSYAVLTACMTGRAFPIAPQSAEAVQTSDPQDEFSSKSVVNEVIWRGLFSQHGIIPKKNEEVS